MVNKSNRENIYCPIMQLVADEEDEIRGRFRHEIDCRSTHHNIVVSNDKKNCRGGRIRRRTYRGSCIGSAFQNPHRHLVRKSSIAKRILGTVIWIAIFSLVERRWCPCTTKEPKRTVLLPTMVLSLSFSGGSRIRSRTISPLFRNTLSRNDGGEGLRLSSDLDGFFEKGGDMDRLVEELSGQQQQQEPKPQQRQNSTSSISTAKENHGWRDGSDPSLVAEKQTEKASSASPVEARTVRGRRVYIKHDDQLRLSGSGISGNKARKMWTLNKIPAESFPSCLVSYGGPQSNSMLALAAVANYKNRELLLGDEGSTGDSSSTDDNPDLPIRFVYYTKKLPRFLRKQPNGNFFRALSLGMELVEVSHEEYGNLFEHRTGGYEGGGRPPMGLKAPLLDSLWVPQGGAFAPAREGARMLAQEIYDFWWQEGKERPLTVCVPGGTCTTALLLHHELQKMLSCSADTDNGVDGCDGFDCENDGDSPVPSLAIMDVEVVVVPCVGDARYARRQMMSLAAEIGASPDDIPTILQPGPEEEPGRQSTSSGTRSPKPPKYFAFGKPHKTILDTFQELQNDCNLLVDLIYGAPSFAIMWRHWGNRGDSETSFLSPDLSFDPKQPLAGREIMYVHSGGLEGINSQLLRYKYEGLVEIKDVQLPGRQSRSKARKRKK